MSQVERDSPQPPPVPDAHKMQRLELLERLLGALAHDLNDQMTAISGRCELLASKFMPGSEVAADAGMIAETARAAGELLSRVRTAAGVEVEASAGFAVDRILAQACERQVATVPAAKKRALTPPPADDDEMRGDEIILVIEDIDTVRLYASRVLRSRGYCVLEAAGAEEALAIAECYPKPIDLVLSDVMLPTFLGPEIVEDIKTVQPGSRILYMSGHHEEVLRRFPRINPHTDLMHKPFSAQELLARVRELLDVPRFGRIRRLEVGAAL